MDSGQNELHLVQLIREDDSRALTLLFKKYYISLCNFASLIVSSSEIAEEIVSDIFVKIWDKRKELRIERNVKTYLFKATKYHAINYLRQEKKVLDDVTENIPLKSYNPAEVLMYQELEHSIETMIDLLPAKRKMIFQLSRFDGFTYQEIANILSISVKTVENQMGKAIKQLKFLLDAHQL